MKFSISDRSYAPVSAVFVLLCLLNFPDSGLRAQNYARTGMPIEIDIARFRRNEWTRVEIYFAIPRHAFGTQHTADGPVAVLHSRIQIWADTLIAEDLIRHEAQSSAEPDDASGIKIITAQSTFLLKPGNYTLLLTVNGPSPETSGQVRQSFLVTPFSRDELTASDIELGLLIQAEPAATQFTKNGLSVIPNPTGIYSASWPVLWYYMEIYNLSPLEQAEDSTYTTRWALEDANGRSVFAGALKRKIRKFNSLVEAGRIEVAELPRGSYKLVLTATDGADSSIVRRSRHFFIHQKLDSAALAERPSLRGRIEFDVYESMDEKALDLHFEQAAMLATSEEKRIFANMDLDGKRAFLRQFWRRRDPDPSTEANEFQALHIQRVLEADKHFVEGKKEGWRTDRGRIYIKYGPPDEIERHPSNIGVRAYQVWHYHGIDGGVAFIFVDRRSLGDLTLVHSTKRDEIYDEQWQRWLH